MSSGSFQIGSSWPHLVAACRPLRSLLSARGAARRSELASKHTAASLSSSEEVISTEAIKSCLKHLDAAHLPKGFRATAREVLHWSPEDQRSLIGMGQHVIGGSAQTSGATSQLGHTRGFHTKRPAGGTGFQTGSGGAKTQSEEETGRGSLSAMVSKFTKSSRWWPFTAESAEMGKLQGLLEKNPTTVKAQEQVKVAFAEGYMSGAGKPKKQYSVLRTMFNALCIGYILYYFWTWRSDNTSKGLKEVIMGGDSEDTNILPEEVKVDFSHVKGIDEATEELQDVVDFLKNPERFTDMGAKLPKGVLLSGPPGTGKTLLAKAVAGEAGVPFFFVSGSDFDGMFVGQGATRVRKLFAKARTKAPCVVFIDEIDSVGSTRSSNPHYPYANQTINQLLSEMDGFNSSEGIIVLGSTNRKESLDKALLRPGRFDLKVEVPPPDKRGRIEIMKLYLSKVKADPGVDVESLALGTIGWTGAKLENMVNQAALRAVLTFSECVTMEHMEYALDKVIMGPEMKSREKILEDNKLTAYHEAGHALMSLLTKGAMPLHKITIISRSNGSGGHTAFRPERDTMGVNKQELIASMDVSMGGLVAEELFNGSDRVSSGPSADLQHATQTANMLVKRFGMSDKVGFRVMGEKDEVSETHLALVDSEISRLLKESYERTKKVLMAHTADLQIIAEALLEHETLTASDAKLLLDGKKLQKEVVSVKRPPKDSPKSGTSGDDKKDSAKPCSPPEDVVSHSLA